MASCPECEAEIELSDVEEELGKVDVGDPFNCFECGAALRVKDLSPFQVEGDEDEDEDEEEIDEEKDLGDLDDEDEDEEDWDQ